MSQPSGQPGNPSTPEYLTLPGLPKALALLGAAYAISTEKGATLLAQPDVTLSLIPTLPEDLALVREHVTAFRDGESLSGGVMNAFEAMRTIAESVQDLASAMVPVARRLDAGTVGASGDLAEFRSALEAMKVRTTALDPDAHSAALSLVQARGALAGFASGELADDQTRFQAAADAVQQAEVIAKLESQISALQSQIDGLNEQVAEGATSQILESITFGFEILESAFKAETDAGSAVLGVGFAIKGEVEKGIAFAEEMKRRNEQLDNLIEQYRGLVEGLISDQQQMALLLIVSGHTKGFAKSVNDAADAVQSLLGQVQLLGQGIDDLVLVDDSSGNPDFFTGQLDSAIAAWAAVADDCEQQLRFARSLS